MLLWATTSAPKNHDNDEVWLKIEQEISTEAVEENDDDEND